MTNHQDHLSRKLAGVLKTHVYGYNPRGGYRCACGREFATEGHVLEHVAEALASGLIPASDEPVKLTEKQEAVLQALRDHANEAGVAQVSLVQLVADSEVQTSTVRTSLQRLMQDKKIEMLTSGSYGKPATYLIKPEN